MLRALTNLVEWVASISVGILAVVIIIGAWMLSAALGAVLSIAAGVIICIALVAGGTKAGLEERRKASNKR